MRRLVAGLGLALAACATAGPPPGAIQLTPDTVAWRDGPLRGTQSAVLEGDPRKEGLFTMRLRVPAGTRLAPHWHPRDERVTVLSGAVMVGFGEMVDEGSATRIPAGGYYVNPAKVPHYLWFPEPSLVQITALGPWELYYLDEAVKPDAAPAR